MPQFLNIQNTARVHHVGSKRNWFSITIAMSSLVECSYFEILLNRLLLGRNLDVARSKRLQQLWGGLAVFQSTDQFQVWQKLQINNRLVADGNGFIATTGVPEWVEVIDKLGPTVQSAGLAQRFDLGQQLVRYGQISCEEKRP